MIPRPIEDYAARHSSPETQVFKKLARHTQRYTELPQMQVGHLEGRFLKMLVHLSGARTVLEIGTFTGYSALAMAEALPSGGRLITCDINPKTAAMARKFWSQSPHGRKIELRIGPALETIRKIRHALDFVFIDADKPNYRRYWDLCVPKVRRGGLIAVDNVLWSGRVLHPKDDTDRVIASFNRYVRKDTRVELVMLTIRDGITLARKK